MAINLGSAYGKISLHVDDFMKGIKTARSSLDNMTSTFSKAGNALTLGLTLPLVAFGTLSIKAAMDAENAMAELNAVLKSTGGIAGVTAEEVTKYAAAMQKITKFDDEAIISGQSMLLTFTKIGKDVFPQASTAMLNMAEKFGSVKEASIQLGKALNDPISGVSALRRVGVMLSDEQERQIKNFMDVNDIASAQKVILGELETEFGGLAAAAGATTEGKLTQFKNSLNDLEESVGKILLPKLIMFIDALNSMIEKFQNLPPGMQDTIVNVGLFLAVLGPAAKIISGFLSIFSLFGSGGALAGMGTFFTATLIPAIGSLGTALGAAAVAIGAALLPILVVLAAVVIAVSAFVIVWKLNLFDIQGTVKTWVTIMGDLWHALTAFLKGDNEEALAAVHDAWATFTDKMQERFGGFAEWMKTTWNSLVTAIGQYATRARDWVVRAFQIDWGALGKNIISGLINGFLSGLSAMIAAATTVANTILNTIKRILGIHSPSAMTFKLGLQTAQGYMLGVQGGINSNAIAQVMARPIQNISNNSPQQYFTMNVGSGLVLRQTEAMIAASREEIMDSIGKMLSSA